MRPVAGRVIVIDLVTAVMVLIGGSHAPVAEAAMEAGLHVFTEKPLALSVAEGKSMVERAQATNRVLMVGYMKRYDPAYERLADAPRVDPEPVDRLRNRRAERLGQGIEVSPGGVRQIKPCQVRARA